MKNQGINRDNLNLLKRLKIR